MFYIKILSVDAGQQLEGQTLSLTEDYILKAQDSRDRQMGESIEVDNRDGTKEEYQENSFLRI